MKMLRQALDDVASLVDLTALDRRMTAEGLPDRLRQRLRPVDDEEAADARIEAAANEAIEERLHRRGILGRAFNDGQRVPVALAVDPTAATSVNSSRSAGRRSGSQAG